MIVIWVLELDLLQSIDKRTIDNGEKLQKHFLSTTWQTVKEYFIYKFLNKKNPDGYIFCKHPTWNFTYV